MANLEISCNKINKFLASFLTDGSLPTIKENNCKSITPACNNFSTPKNSIKTKTSLDAFSHQSERISDEPAFRKTTGSEIKKTLPNNEHDFKVRLLSFALGLWTSVDLSPLLCASYGWHMIEKDILKCRTCKATLCSSLPSPNRHEAYQKFLGILKERLKTGHKEWCGWPSHPCPPAFVQPPRTSTVHYMKNLLSDARKLCSLDNSLPYVDRREMLNRLDLDYNHVSLFFVNGQEPTSVPLTAAILVLFGWAFETPQKIKCNLCMRNVGLWSFVSLGQEEELLGLKKKNNAKQERKRQKENKRKEIKERRKFKEEKRLAIIERKRKIEEAEERAKEESRKVQEAMDKISRLEESGMMSDLEGSEADKEDLTEDEEKSLLEEEEKDSSIEKSGCSDESEEVEETFQMDSDSQKKINDENAAVIEESSNMKEDESSNNSSDSEKLEEETARCSPDSSGNDLNRSSDDEHDRDSEISSEGEENKNSEHGAHSERCDDDDDELWLEAVGGFEGDVDQARLSSNGSVEDDFHDSYDSSSCEGSETNRKRGRISEDESDLDAEDISAKKAKLDQEASMEYCTKADVPGTDDGLETIDNNQAGAGNIDTTNNEVIGNGIEAANISEVTTVNSHSDAFNISEATTNNEVTEDGLEAVKISEVFTVNSAANSISEASVLNTEEVIAEDNSTGTGCNKNGFSANDEEISSESDVSEDEEGPDEEETRLHKLESSMFDPVGEHRHWCGWVTESIYTEGEESNVVGYKILPPQLREILPQFTSPNLAASEKYARNVEGLRAVRNILDSWAVHEVEAMEL